MITNFIYCWCSFEYNASFLSLLILIGVFFLSLIFSSFIAMCTGLISLCLSLVEFVVLLDYVALCLSSTLENSQPLSFLTLFFHFYLLLKILLLSYVFLQYPICLLHSSLYFLVFLLCILGWIVSIILFQFPSRTSVLQCLSLIHI